GDRHRRAGAGRGRAIAGGAAGGDRAGVLRRSHVSAGRRGIGDPRGYGQVEDAAGVASDRRRVGCDWCGASMDLTARHFEDLIGAYALDACEPDEVAALDAYVDSHPEIAAEVERLREAAAALGAAGAV